MDKLQPVKTKILEEAWNLFVNKGFDNTTIDDILQVCEISRGGFYHYFESKDDLMTHLSTLLDERYAALSEVIDPNLSEREKLLFYTVSLFEYIEDNVPKDVLSNVMASQIRKNNARFLLDERRLYFQILRNCFDKGRAGGEFDRSITTREYVKMYALQERSILYDWCLCGGQYPLSTYGIDIFKQTIQFLLKK